MKNTLITSKFYMEAFKINKIIFDDTNLVSVDIKSKIQHEWLTATLLFDFALFNDLMRHAGDMGEKLATLVSDKLFSKEQKPYILNLEKEEFIFSSSRLLLSYLSVDDMNCYCVETISPLPYLYQVRNLRKNISDFSSIHLKPNNSFNTTIQELAKLYTYYNALKELNLTDAAAREKSGLQNEYLFKLSYQAYKK